LSLFPRPKLDDSTSPSEPSIEPYKSMALLKSLEYLQEYSDLVWPLLRHVSSSLRVLELEITWEQLLKLFTIIQDIGSLYDLSLYIPLSSTRGELEGNRWKAPALPQVQIFALEITEQVVGPQTLEASDFADAGRLVVEALDSSLPHVHELHLKSNIYTNDLVRLVRTMEALVSLDLTGKTRSHRAEKAICSTLKTLRTGNPNVLRYLHMPNLTSTTLVHPFVEGEEENEPIDRSFASTVQSIAMASKNASAILANGGEFTQLCTLEWYDNHYGYHYQEGSFPSLTKIIFRGDPEATNAFCESLLRYPRLCPRLETICFTKYPEWDMLLYMLLRRNVHHGPNNLSRIMRIETIVYPAPCILVPLRDLLLGRIPLEMPSPEELSFVGIEDICFDPTVYVIWILLIRIKIRIRTDWDP
jgi:hypothetical protein